MLREVAHEPYRELRHQKLRASPFLNRREVASLVKGVIATALSRTTLAIVSPHARPARHAFFVAPEAGLQVQLGGTAAR